MESSPVSHINSMLDFKETDNFITKYHRINNKLKKRFMRNPNVAEASDQFLALAAQCEQEEIWQYAGICYLAVSRCYHTLGNIGSEINYLIKAGRRFLRVNKESTDVGCPSIGQSDLQAASSCIHEAAICCQNESKYNVMVAASMVELSHSLGPTPAGGQLLRKAIKIYPTIQSINILISYCLKQDDYTTALNIVTDLINLIESIGTSSQYYRECLHKAEVNRLMLVLMVHQTSQRLVSPFAAIIEKYTSTTDEAIIGSNISEDEFLVLQSLILACQSHDTEALLELEGELWKYLDTNQKDFLRTLIRNIVNE